MLEKMRMEHPCPLALERMMRHLPTFVPIIVQIASFSLLLRIDLQL